MAAPLKIIVLLGPPAAGKGTQADFLRAQGYDIFSSSACLRQRAARGDELGRRLAEKMAAGILTTDADAVLMEGIEARVKDLRAAGARGLVLDGTPRTINQALMLDQFLAQENLALTVVELVVPQDILNKRRLSRIATMQAVGQEPRKDDKEAVFLHRMEEYRTMTAPLTAHYGQKGVLKQIAATGTPDEVNSLVMTALTERGPGDRRAPRQQGPAPL